VLPPGGHERSKTRSAPEEVFMTPEGGIGFPMSLKGFGEGYDKLP
jgi:invasion protein IalB